MTAHEELAEIRAHIEALPVADRRAIRHYADLLREIAGVGTLAMLAFALVGAELTVSMQDEQAT